MADDQKPFWSSLPGILTGIAALLTAATGLIAAFHGHNKSQAEAQPVPPAITQPASTQPTTPQPASTNGSGVTGFWSGSAEGLKMAVLNLSGDGTALRGTFQRPCVSDRVFDIDSAIWQGTTLVVTITQLGDAGKKHQPAPPVEFDLEQKDGKLTGTFIRAKRHAPITFNSGKQGCPAGATETDS